MKVKGTQPVRMVQSKNTRRGGVFGDMQNNAVGREERQSHI